jgi:transcription elongation factor Elf1
MINFTIGERMEFDCPRCKAGVVDFGICPEEAQYKAMLEASCDGCGHKFSTYSYREIVFQEVGWYEPWAASQKKPEPKRARQDRQGFVYFIRSPANGLVKIGFSANPKERIDSLQTAHGTKLELLALRKGSLGDERALHQRFRPYRVKGEWFEAVDELLIEIGRT